MKDAIGSLIAYIHSRSSLRLSDEEMTLISEKFRPKRLLKRQYFLQEGNVCKFMGFIVSGSTRMFTTNDKGQEHVLRLCLEDWWAGDFESFHLLTPSRYHIEALEDVQMLLITNEQLQELVRKIPAVAEMLESVNRNGVIANHKRMHAAISYSAEERYEDLMNTYPHFFQRFPLNMIASYLGISPETLSRIRKTALTK